MTPDLADFRLPRRARRTLEALVPVVCPPDALDLGLVSAIVDETEQMMRAFPAYARAGLVAGILAFDAGALGFARRTPEARERWFRAWWASPLMPVRQLMKGLKGLLVMAYYESPVVKERMAYHPDRWVAKVATERLERFAAQIAENDARMTAPDPLVSLASPVAPSGRPSPVGRRHAG
jgi:hypothetical protein